jgi:hypothetical protein
MIATEKRRVHTGQEILVALPPSEVCCHLKVADQVRRIRVLDRGVQILNDDGTDFSFPILHGEAGVFFDDEGMFVLPLPATLHQVHQHGKPASPLMAHRNGCFRWIIDHQGQSYDYAVNHGGYSEREVSGCLINQGAMDPTPPADPTRTPTEEEPPS